MNAIVNPDSLLKELKKMSLVVQKNTVLPILKFVKFNFEKDKVTLTATDLETTYISTIKCQCAKPFLLLMEHQDLVDICSNLSAPLEITVADKNILLTSGKSKHKRSLLNETEVFPVLPEDEFYLSFDVDGDFFYYLSVANTFKHDTDPRMDMAAIDISKNENITVVATDSNSLFKKEFPIKVDKQLTVMISSVFITACKLFQDAEISIGTNFIKVEHKGELIISRLSEQKFPNYKSVIKNEIEYNMNVNRPEFRSAINCVSSAANLLLKQVVLKFQSDVVKFETNDADLNKEAETEMEIENTVPIESIGFNADKMKHFLNSLTCDNLDFSFTGVSSSIYFKPSDDDSIFCLLQPVVVQ